MREGKVLRNAGGRSSALVYIFGFGKLAGALAWRRLLGVNRPMFHRWYGFQVRAHDIGNDCIATGAEMNVPEDVVFEVPAARRSLRAVVLHREEFRKGGKEAFALPLAPIAPDLDLA